MKAQFSQDHIPPVPVQPPHFQLQVAGQVGRVLAPSEAKQAEPDSGRRQEPEGGTKAGNAASNPAADLSPQSQKAKSQLEGAQTTLHQLGDLLDGLIEGVAASGFGPQSTRQNQRLLKGAVSIGREILAQAEADGNPLFRVSTADLYSRSRPVAVRQAAAAYGVAASYAKEASSDPPIIRQTQQVIQQHITGPDGILSALQDQADNGPFSTDRVKRNLMEAKATIDGIRSVVARFQAQDSQKFRPIDRAV